MSDPDEAGAKPHVEPAVAAPLVIRKRGRRVSTEPPAGYQGEPPAESDGDEAEVPSGSRDAQLRADVPPHWG